MLILAKIGYFAKKNIVSLTLNGHSNADSVDWEGEALKLTNDHLECLKKPIPEFYLSTFMSKYVY